MVCFTVDGGRSEDDRKGVRERWEISRLCALEIVNTQTVKVCTISLEHTQSSRLEIPILELGKLRMGIENKQNENN